MYLFFFFFSSRRRHTRWTGDWSSDVCSSDLARYEALLAARRYEVVDPTKRLVARELETRWNIALERVADVEERLKEHDAAAALRPKVDRVALISLAHD